MKYHTTILLTLFLLISSISHGEVSSAEPKGTHIQIVGAVGPSKIYVDDKMTFKDFFELVKSTPFTAKSRITVIRINEVYEHVEKNIISGTQKKFIDYRISMNMRLKDLSLKNGDILYIHNKRPVQR